VQSLIRLGPTAAPRCELPSSLISDTKKILAAENFATCHRPTSKSLNG
jgi:hypothetical protein